MPGAVGRTSTYALCNVTLPYILQMARLGWRSLAAADPGVAAGVNITGGRVTNLPVAQTFGLPYHALDDTPSAIPGDGAGALAIGVGPP
jgi:alanine dehydrogenase